MTSQGKRKLYKAEITAVAVHGKLAQAAAETWADFQEVSGDLYTAKPFSPKTVLSNTPSDDEVIRAMIERGFIQDFEEQWVRNVIALRRAVNRLRDQWAEQI